MRKMEIYHLLAVHTAKTGGTGATVRELAEEMDVSRQSVYVHLAALMDIGLIERHPRKQGIYRVTHSWFVEDIFAACKVVSNE